MKKIENLKQSKLEVFTTLSESQILNYNYPDEGLFVTESEEGKQSTKGC